MNREVSKFVPCPDLSPELIQQLTQLVFVPDNPPHSVDLLLVFGNHQAKATATKTIETLQNTNCKKVVISGGNPQFNDPVKPNRKYETEAEEIMSFIPSNTYENVEFILEKRANSTKDNAVYANELIPFAELSSIGIVCVSVITRRSRLSIQQLNPTAQLYTYSLPRIDHVTGQEILFDNWMHIASGRDRIYAEYLRLKLYGGRGDIAYPEDVKNLVKKIDYALSVKD